ncbi:MAG: DISARM system phospholipase D-like protein DrmC [Chloroflexota bacterium]|nr:DISARM system phospholipase D-like protein DrmC [Chloroflexota bacterium]
MTDPYDSIVRGATHLAVSFPPGVLGTIAHMLSGCQAGDWPAIRRTIAQVTPQPHARAVVDEFVAAWRQDASTVTPREVALALRTAVATASRARAEQVVELAWTGPLVTGVSMRRTDQALLQVIEAARQSLLVVSFAVYDVPAVAAALVRAASRGVVLRICVEAPEPSGQKMVYDTIQALGPDVAKNAAIYIWPRAQRVTNADGKFGALHAKCAVADSRLLFVSSANLTGYALSLNMELGLLVEGGALPGTVMEQFEEMIGRGVLQRILTA